MIKHLPEGTVPFEDCGFARYPQLACLGEEVMVRCRVDDSAAVPVLTLVSENGSRTLRHFDRTDNYYAFSLGDFDSLQEVSYQFKTDEEKTPWYSFDVAQTQIISCFTSFYQQGEQSIAAILCDDVILNIDIAKHLKMTLRQAALDASETEKNSACEHTFKLPGDFSLRCHQEGLWALYRAEEEVCKATEYQFWRDKDGKILKMALKLRMSNLHILGTGERFDAVDQYLLGTNGRVVEKFTHQDDQTYLPIPFFMTEQGYGWFRDSDIPVEMSFGTETVLSQETETGLLSKDILLFGQPSDVLKQFINLTGEAVLPPQWAFGLWVSGNGWNSDHEVDEQLRLMKEHQYPATVMVLEQWSDEQTFYEWHSKRFPNPQQTVKNIREAGLHLVLWQIPVIKHEWDGLAGADLIRDQQDAIAQGYVIKNGDGTPYRITERWFHHSLLPDFTNPAACDWWFNKRKYLLDMGVEGFKTDGGEFLFDKTARLFNGSSGLSAHNVYPNQYVKAYHDFMQAQDVCGVTFSRAGYVGAQSLAIHWAGDQTSEWCELQNQLRAGISSGLSGVLFWSFDIGGFAGPLPDAELYLRATAMGCFCPVMQWHAEPRGGQFSGGKGKEYNNDRSPWNMAEKLNDQRLLDIACSYARLRERLHPYIWEEARYCVLAGRPLMAHLCLDYPQIEKVWGIHDQYMLGRDLLVAPVMEKGKTERKIYLPPGDWEDYFTGGKLKGEQDITAVSPIGSIPVYRKVSTDE